MCKLLANSKGQRVIDELVQADTLTFGFFGQQAVQCFRYTHYEPAAEARLHIDKICHKNGCYEIRNSH